MAALLDNLHYTVRSIFELYFAFGKKLYASTIVVLLWINLVAGLIAGGCTWLTGYFLNRPEFVGPGTPDNPFLHLLSTSQLTGLNQAIIILLLSLYGIALVRGREAGEPIALNLRWYISRINGSEWKVVGGCFVLLLVLHVLLFVNPFSPQDMGGGLLGMFDSFANEFTLRQLLYDSTEAVKNFLLPCLLGMLIVLYSMWGTINSDILRQCRTAWITSLFLFFSFNAVLTALLTLFDNTVLRLLIIPVMGLPETNDVRVWSVLIFGTVCKMLIQLLFQPALALSLIWPFYYEEEAAEEEMTGGIGDIEEEQP